MGGRPGLLCSGDMLSSSRGLSETGEQACRYLALGGRVFQGNGTKVQRPGGGVVFGDSKVWLVGSGVGQVGGGTKAEL